MQLPITLLQAIAREEGFYTTGTRSCRNNNPGNIEFGKFTQAHGATSGDPRFAVFPTAELGFAAMQALFQAPGYKGLTLSEALNRWAPPVENATNVYITNVCTWTNLTADMVIDDHLEPFPISSGGPAPIVVAAVTIPATLADPTSAMPVPSLLPSQNT